MATYPGGRLFPMAAHGLFNSGTVQFNREFIRRKTMITNKAKIKYDVIVETDQSQFVDMVNERLEKSGWFIHGNTFTIMMGVGNGPGGVALAHFAQAFIWLESTHE